MKVHFTLFHVLFPFIVTCAIALHQSSLECKTAKPLLDTVYKTGNRKQLGRKWSGKELC